MVDLFSFLKTLAFILLFTVIPARAQVNFVADTLSGCAPLTVNFQDLSTQAVSWSWNLGGGVSSNLQNPGRIFNTPGTYDISLTITDVNGQMLSLTKPLYITVYAGPNINFQASRDTICRGDSVSFTDLSMGGSSGLAQWLWDFGDGTSSTLQNPTHTYTQAGSFNVALSVTDSNGCSGLLFQQHLVTVNAPDAGFTSNPFSGCQAPLFVTFIPFTTSGVHSWNFGNSNTSTLSQPSHTYLNNGQYTVTHILTDAGGCSDTVVRPNMISVGVGTVNITSTPANPCPGDTVWFSVNNSTPVAQASWNFGDNSTSTSVSPYHIYQGGGPFTVTVLLNTFAGCALNGTTTVNVIVPPPVSFFTADSVSCANPFTVNFTDQTPGAVAWEWKFGNGATSNQQNPSFTYNFPGEYDIKLIVADVNGCVDSIQYHQYINVGAITADFVGAPSKGCAPLDVSFRVLDPSNRNSPPQPNRPPLSQWLWDFGDGGSSTLPRPVHTYMNAGTYSVSLIITNSGGCKDTLHRPATVTVGNPLNADFSILPDSGCADTAFNFMNLTTGNVTLTQWKFGDGNEDFSFNASHVYRDTGLFTVTLIVEDRGCADTIEKVLRVYPPVARFGLSPDKGCDTPVQVTFNDVSIGADTWLWDFGDGGSTSTLTNPSHTYTQPGVYPVSLIVTNLETGCRDSTGRLFFVQDVKASFRPSVYQGCAPLTVQFFDSSTNAASWAWNFRDGSQVDTTQNPTHTFTRAGVYYVSLQVKNSLKCEGDTVLEIPILIGDPIADFLGNDTTGCAPFTTSFTDLSLSPLPIVAWNWSLGTSTSTQASPTASYGTGYYDIQLIITDSVGCKDTLLRKDHIYVTRPTVAFSVNDPINCPNNPIRFFNQSTGQQLSYHWDFGDGDTSIFLSPTHSYALPGQYTVSLTVTDVNGCDTTLTQLQYISITDPQADFTADTTYANCPPLLVNFSGMGLSSHPFSNWNWNLGNGNNGFQQNVSNLYTQPGIYTVSLIAATSYGCADTIVKTGLIQLDGPSGNFAFNPKQGCPGLTVNFVGNGTNVLMYEWDMDDGSLALGQQVSHVYGSPGIYHPRLIVSDTTGCRVFIPSPDSIIVFTPPVADFTASTTLLCDSGIVNFMDTSTPLGSIVSQIWLFGNGNTATGPNPSRTFLPGGPYNAQLIVEDVNGCRDTVLKPNFIQVNPSPKIEILPSDTIACPPLEVPFRVRQLRGNAALASWQWNFGVPGGTSIQARDTFTYLNAGTYQVSLTVSDANGCTTDTTTKVTVRTPPQPDFSSLTQVGCAPVAIQFNDLTPGNIVSWFWQFGDGGVSTQRNPSHYYLKDTLYTVSLRVIDIYGCEAEIIKPNYINLSPQPLPIADAGPPMIKMCFGDSVVLPGSATNLPANVQYTWSPSLGISDSSILQPKASPAFTTTYFLVAGAPGCPPGPSDSIRVVVHAVPTIDPGPDLSMCFGDSVLLEGKAGGDWDPATTYQYTWTPSQGLSNPNVAQPMASPNQSTSYLLRVLSSQGCESEVASVQVEVFATPLAEAGPKQKLCFGDSLQLIGSHSFLTPNPPGGFAFYEWSPQDSILGELTPSPLVFPTSSTTYYLKVAFGACESIDSIEVEVLAAAKAQVSADTNAICEGGSILLAATDSPQVGATYRWSPIKGLNNALLPNPTASPIETTTYVVTVDQDGCSAVDSIEVVVYPKPIVSFRQERTENCEQYEVAFAAQVQQGQTLIWDFGDGSPTTNDPRPFHIYSQPGLYIPSLRVLGNGGCEVEVIGLAIEVGEGGIAAFMSEPDTGEVMILPQATVNFIDLSINPISWNWDFGDGNTSMESDPVHQYKAPGEYQVSLTIKDSIGCVQIFQLAPYKVVAPELFIPNVFTPNSDGINDQFLIEYSGVEAFHLQIFDRWGKILFSHEGDPGVGWNGDAPGGGPASEGVYYYVVKVGSRVYQGNLTLMR